MVRLSTADKQLLNIKVWLILNTLANNQFYDQLQGPNLWSPQTDIKFMVKSLPLVQLIS